jgi:hypothetical protein
MNILVDADALPGVIKEILFRAAQRRRLPLILVANKNLQVPLSDFIRTIRVGQGFDVVDDAIVEMVQPGDLVVTADIPLAAKVVEKGANALNPRGALYDKDTIQAALTMRNLLYELREGGLATGGPPPMSRRDREAFANSLDRLLTTHTGA